MPYIAPEIVAQARQVDLLTYLKNYEPSQLVPVCRNTFVTKEHDSLKISNGLWYWFSKGVGGKNAIDYLMIVKNLSFINAVQTVLGNMKIQAPVKYEQEEKNHERRLKIPVKASNNARAINYLLSRGIDKEIIQYCIENKLLYQEERTNNVVFIGYDNNKIPSYAFCRATNQERFMREATGSNKKYSFKIKAEKENNIVHLFESAIDLLSYATLMKQKNLDYHKENMISLAGVFKPSEHIENIKLPVTITKFLEENPQVNQIHLHLDNDEVGRKASQNLVQILSKKYKVLDRPPPIGKDCNDYLKHVLGIRNITRKTKEKVR